MIEQDAERCARAENLGGPTDWGNAASAEALLAAGIDRAAAILVAMGSDANNVHIRAPAPQPCVIARAATSETVERLTVSGAARVLSPYAAGAEPMASYVLKPNVGRALSELLGTKSKDMTIEEVAIASGSSYAGQNIGDERLRQHRVAVMAIGRNAGQRFRPPWEETICAGDVLTMMGPPPNVQQFAKQAGK